jgi:hypothetical protein
MKPRKVQVLEGALRLEPQPGRRRPQMQVAFPDGYFTVTPPQARGLAAALEIWAGDAERRQERAEEAP